VGGGHRTVPGCPETWSTERPQSGWSLRGHPHVPFGHRNAHRSWPSSCREKHGHLDINIMSHHDAYMRTTLTLDPDVARRLEREMKLSGEGMKAVVNRALRVGLGMTDKPVKPGAFRVVPHDFEVRPGVDLDRMNQLVDELESEAAARKLVP